MFHFFRKPEPDYNGFLANITEHSVFGPLNDHISYRFKVSLDRGKYKESMLGEDFDGMWYSERRDWEGAIEVQKTYGKNLQLKSGTCPPIKFPERLRTITFKTRENYENLPDVSRFISPWFLASETFIDRLGNFEGVVLQTEPINLQIENCPEFEPERKFFAVFVRNRFFFSEPDRILLLSHIAKLVPAYLYGKYDSSFRPAGQSKLVYCLAYFDSTVFEVFKSAPMTGAGLLESDFLVGQSSETTIRSFSLTGLRSIAEGEAAIPLIKRPTEAGRSKINLLDDRTWEVRTAKKISPALQHRIFYEGLDHILEKVEKRYLRTETGTKFGERFYYVEMNSLHYQRTLGLLCSVKGKSRQEFAFFNLDSEARKEKERVKYRSETIAAEGTSPRVELARYAEMNPETHWHNFSVKSEKSYARLPDIFSTQSWETFVVSTRFIEVMKTFDDVDFQVWPVNKIYLADGTVKNQDRNFWHCYIRTSVRCVEDHRSKFEIGHKNYLFYASKGETRVEAGIHEDLITAAIDNPAIHKLLTSRSLLRVSWGPSLLCNEPFFEACKKAKITGLREYGAKRSTSGDNVMGFYCSS